MPASRTLRPLPRAPLRLTGWRPLETAGAAVDAPRLARLSLALAYADEAAPRAQALGLLVKATDTGLPIQSPWAVAMNPQTDIARMLAAELALPPAQRSCAAWHGRRTWLRGPTSGACERAGRKSHAWDGREKRRGRLCSCSSTSTAGYNASQPPDG